MEGATCMEVSELLFCRERPGCGPGRRGSADLFQSERTFAPGCAPAPPPLRRPPGAPSLEGRSGARAMVMEENWTSALMPPPRQFRGFQEVLDRTHFHWDLK